MSFRVKFYEFVNKPKAVKTLEHNCLELVKILNEKQKALALFVQKLTFINDIYILGLNNYTLELNTIKIGHHTALKYLRALLNRYHTTSVQMVDAIEEMFKSMSTIEQYKNRIIQHYSLHTAKPIELRFHLMKNKTYQNELIKMLMMVQRMTNLYYKKVNETKQVNIYIGNILDIQKKLLGIYKENPYEMTSNVNNAKYINGLRKQHEFERKLLNDFNANDVQYENLFKKIKSNIHKFKELYDIPPLLLNMKDRNFGSYKHLIQLKNKISLAISKQQEMLERELADINQRDAMKNKFKLEPKLFIKSDPKMLNLMGQQAVVNKHLAQVPEELKLNIATLDACLKRSDADIDACIQAHKMSGGGKPVKTGELNNISKLINYLKFKETLEKDNNKIRIALQSLYKIQRELSKNAEFGEAVRQAEYYEKDLEKKFTEHMIAEAKLRNSEQHMNEHMDFTEQLRKLNNPTPLLSGGTKDIIVLDKLGDYNKKLILANNIQKRHQDEYKKVKMQYNNYVQDQIAKGSTQSTDQLVKDAFYKEVYHMVRQELKNCTDLPLEEVSGVVKNKLYGGTLTFPGVLEGVVHDRLNERDAKWGLFKGLSSKLVSLFGPTSEQYEFIQKVINNAIADHKTELMHRYGYSNYTKLENEFLKADLCASNVQEKLFQHIDLFPNYDTLCQINGTLRYELVHKDIKGLLDLSAKIVECTHTHAIGWKDMLEKACKKLDEEGRLLQSCIRELYENTPKGKDDFVNSLFEPSTLDSSTLEAKMMNKLKAKACNFPSSVPIITGNIGDTPQNLINLNKGVAEVLTAVFKHVRKKKEQMQVEISDSRNNLYNGSYDLKNHLDKLYDIINNTMAPNFKRKTNLKCQSALLDAVKNFTGNELIKDPTAKPKLSNIELTLNNNKSNLEISIATIETNIDKRLKTIADKCKSSIKTHTSTYYNKLEEYRTMLSMVVCVTQVIMSHRIAMQVVCKDKYNEYKKESKFNEDILTYNIDHDARTMEMFDEQHNSLLKLRMKYTELLDKLEFCDSKCVSYRKQYNNNFKKLHTVATDNDVSDMMTKMYAHKLIQKNLSKLHKEKEKKTAGMNARRLHQAGLKLHQDKMFTMSKYTNKVDLVKSIFAEVQISMNNMGNLYDQINHLLGGSFKFMMSKLMKKYLIMMSSLDAHKLLSGYSTTDGEIHSELSSLYKEMWNKFMCLNPEIFNIAKYHYKDIATKICVRLTTPASASIPNQNISNIHNDIKNCATASGLKFNDIATKAANFQNNYGLSLNPEVTDEDTVKQLIAMEYL